MVERSYKPKVVWVNQTAGLSPSLSAFQTVSLFTAFLLPWWPASVACLELPHPTLGLAKMSLMVDYPTQPLLFINA